MNKRLAVTLWFTFIALLALPLFVLAQASTIPDPSNLGEFLKAVLAAATSGQWKVLAALAIVGLVWVIRTYGGKLWPFLTTDAGGAWTVFVTGILGAVAAALYAGQDVTWAVIVAGVGLAWAAGGAWSGLRKMLRPLVPLLAKVPVIGAALAKLLEQLVGQDPVAAVQAAADAAKTATPPTASGSNVATGLDPK